MNIIINKPVYKEIIKYYPTLKENKLDQLFFFSLIYPHPGKTDSGNRPISSVYYQKLFGKNINLTKFISEFEKKYSVKLDIDNNINIGKCKTVDNFIINSELQTFINNFRLTSKDIFMKIEGAKTRKVEIITENDDHKIILDKLNSEDTARVLQKVFNKNKNKVLESISKIEDQNKYMREISVYQSCQEMTSRYYISKSGIRVFAEINNVNYFKRNIRKLALSGCYELDLRSSQLAIFAKLTKSLKLLEFLNSDKNIWQHMADVSGLPLTAENKAQFKIYIYKIVFGAAKSNLEEIPNINKDPIFVELLANRKLLKEKVKADGGITDAYGKKHLLEIDGNSTNVRSIIAIAVQSYELILMAEIFKYSDKYFTIVNFLHDGLAIKFKDDAKAAGIINQLIKRVGNKAKELNILTQLEVEKL